MKTLRHAAFLTCLAAGGTAFAQEPRISNKEPLPMVQPLELTDPVAVPESIAATLLAGVAFLMMFSRRRYID